MNNSLLGRFFHLLLDDLPVNRSREVQRLEWMIDPAPLGNERAGQLSPENEDHSPEQKAAREKYDKK